MRKEEKLSITKDVERLYAKLQKAALGNAKKYMFYYGEQTTSALGIKTPNELATCSFALGWAAVAVNVLQERTKFTGFYSSDKNRMTELNNIYEDSFLEDIQFKVLKDLFVTGNGYMSVAPGNIEANEPEILLMAESSSNVYGERNPRTGLLSNALKVIGNNEKRKALYYTSEAIYNLSQINNGKWVIDEENINEHNLGFVPMIRFTINESSIYPEGKSVITKPLRSYIWQAMDTLVGASQTLHYFAYPLRVFLNTASTMFEDLGDDSRTQLQILGEIRDAITVPYNNKDSQEVKVQQLSGNNPDGILSNIDIFAKLAAREIGVSPSYLGLNSVNPTAADALDAEERKLVHTVNSFIPSLRKGFKQALKLSFLIKDNAVPEDFNNIGIQFMRPETYTPAAAADRALKIKQANVFEQEFPRWFYEQLGMDSQEIKQTEDFLAKNKVKKAAEALIGNLPLGTVQADTPENTGESISDINIDIDSIQE